MEKFLCPAALLLQASDLSHSKLVWAGEKEAGDKGQGRKVQNLGALRRRDGHAESFSMKRLAFGLKWCFPGFLLSGVGSTRSGLHLLCCQRVSTEKHGEDPGWHLCYSHHTKIRRAHPSWSECSNATPLPRSKALLLCTVQARALTQEPEAACSHSTGPGSPPAPRGFLCCGEKGGHSWFNTYIHLQLWAL